MNLVHTILQILFFYNPLVWLANAAVRCAREQAVDETALACLGPEAAEYSNTLIDIAEIAHARPSLSLRLIGVVESQRVLASRIEHIINHPFPSSARLGTTGGLVVIIAAVILLPMARGQTPNTQTNQFGKSMKVAEAIEPGFGKAMEGIIGFVTDKSARPCGNVYIADSLGEFGDAVTTDARGRFRLQAMPSEEKTWIAYSPQLRAMGMFNVSADDQGRVVRVVLEYGEALVQGRIIKPNGKGLDDRRVEFVITTNQGQVFCLQSDRRTDRFGNYGGNIPCGPGLTVQARPAEGSDTERKYISKPVSLTDNQSFVPMPILIVWPGAKQRL